MAKEGMDRVVAYLRHNGESRVVDMLRHLQISKQALHKQLVALIALGQIQKDGSAPKVVYSLAKSPGTKVSKIYNWSTDEEAFKNANPQGYEIWYLQQMINYGKEGLKIPENAVRQNWEQIKGGLEPTYREYINFLLWPNQKVS